MMNALVWNAKNDKNAGKQAVRILDQTLASYHNGNLHMKLDRIIFSQVINCIAQVGASKAGFEALDILRRLQLLHKQDRDGDQDKGHDHDTRRHDNDDLKPDTVTFNSVLLAFANSCSEAAALKAEQISQGMIKISDSSVNPNVMSYTTVISAWAKSGYEKALKRVEKILLGMEDSKYVQPNTVTYATVLNAFAQSDNPSSADLAMRTLQRVEEGNAKARPNAYCYGSAMDCISKFAEKDSIFTQTEPLLRRMIDNQQSQNHEGDENKSKPESYTVVFNTALKAIQKSPVKRKDEVATKFMDLMMEVNSNTTNQTIRAHPSTQTYSLFIRACVVTKGDPSEKKAAFHKAMDALQDLRSSNRLRPDTYTYPAIFRAGEELPDTSSSSEDLELIRNLFTMCCEDGLVSGLLLNNMKNFLPKDFLSLLWNTEKDPPKVNVRDLPVEWRKHRNQTNIVH